MRRLTVFSARLRWGFVAGVGATLTATFALLAVHAYQPTGNWATCAHPLHPVVMRPGKTYLLCHARDLRVFAVHPHQAAALFFVVTAISAALITFGALVVFLPGIDVGDNPAAVAHRRRSA